VDDGKDRAPSRGQYLRSLAWVRPALALAILYCLGLSLLVALFRRLPPLSALAEAEAAAAGGEAGAAQLELRIPHSFEELRAVRGTLERYRKAYGGRVAALLIAAYIFMQTFLVPGPAGINVLAGSLYPFPTAMLFAAVVSTVGASLNYLLVRALLKDVVTALFPARVAAFQQELRRHSAHLFNYMLFVRVTPVLPHWFVNVASPIVGVPFPVFVAATAVGHQPMNFFTVQAGAALQSVRSVADLYSVKNVAFLMTAGAAALAPVVWKRRRGAAAAQRQPMLLVIDRSTSGHVS
jgi:uncharacterized membrane protein YdjX (TVP38/TMEM64 family)